MSNSSADLQVEVISNGPETTTNGKKSVANGSNGLEAETDLGSAASSANSSGEDGESSEVWIGSLLVPCLYKSDK